MDQKTKEIVERLREIFQRRRYGPGEYDPDFDILEPVASLITRLSERMGELETESRESACELLSAEACIENLTRLLSKQEERG